jgi:hypothetical protein
VDKACYFLEEMCAQRKVSLRDTLYSSEGEELFSNLGDARDMLGDQVRYQLLTELLVILDGKVNPLWLILLQRGVVYGRLIGKTHLGGRLVVEVLHALEDLLEEELGPFLEDSHSLGHLILALFLVLNLECSEIACHSIKGIDERESLFIDKMPLSLGYLWLSQPSSQVCPQCGEV